MTKSGNIEAAAAAYNPNKDDQARKIAVKLFQLLEDGSAPDAMWWLDGETFAANSEHFQSQVLDPHFRGVKYASFVRTMHKMGFARISRLYDVPKGVVAYSREFFERGKPELLQKINMTSLGRHAQAAKMATAKNKQPPRPKKQTAAPPKPRVPDVEVVAVQRPSKVVAAPPRPAVKPPTAAAAVSTPGQLKPVMQPGLKGMIPQLSKLPRAHAPWELAANGLVAATQPPHARAKIALPLQAQMETSPPHLQAQLLQAQLLRGPATNPLLQAQLQHLLPPRILPLPQNNKPPMLAGLQASLNQRGAQLAASLVATEEADRAAPELRSPVTETEVQYAAKLIAEARLKAAAEKAAAEAALPTQLPQVQTTPVPEAPKETVSAAAEDMEVDEEEEEETEEKHEAPPHAPKATALQKKMKKLPKFKPPTNTAPRPDPPGADPYDVALDQTTRLRILQDQGGLALLPDQKDEASLAKLMKTQPVTTTSSSSQEVSPTKGLDLLKEALASRTE